MKSRFHRVEFAGGIPPQVGMCALTAFTLVEILVSMAVLIMILGMLVQMLNSATATTAGSSAHIEADSQARMVFDRLADDFAAMPKRRDVDFVFSKEDGGGSGLNDQFFFFSDAPGFFDTAAVGAPQSPLTLIGYQVDPASNFQLKRLAKGMPWGRSATGQGNPMVFLTLPSNTSFAPDSQSTLEGSPFWQSVINGSDSDYALFSPGVYRLECCYFLKDGTYSNKPITSAPGVTNNLQASGAPGNTNDSSSNFSAGSRWYDISGKRGYICLSADPGAAVWYPLGMDDVLSIVVALAVLDEPSRKRVPDLTQAMKAFPDPSDTDLAASPPKLMASTWQAIADSPTFASTAGLPKSVAGKVRIYQRYFSITPP